jgi:simple sugar transport system ATP-binding protein
VLENVMIGSESLFRLVTRRGAARRRLRDVAERFGLAVDPAARVGDLSVGERQRVEIVKALDRDARILILDEPTAVLARPEAERLFETLRSMTAGGLSIIFISHKLDEVMAAADRVVVLRGGKVVAERRTADTSRAELAELMVGRRIARPVRAHQEPGNIVVAAGGITVAGAGTTRLDNIDFDVRAGEILGIIGVAGNGQAALGALLSGRARPTRGSLTLDGGDMARMSPLDLVRAGVGRVPEDRHAEGMVGEMAVWENATLERLRAAEFSKLGVVRRGAARAFAAGLIGRFDIRGAAPDTRTGLQSGGNKQKLILGRSLASPPRLIIANQPTPGLDEGANAAVHRELLAARATGAAIVLISEDLDEVLALADRIQAMFRGRLSAPVAADAADARMIGLMMAGSWEAEHEA